MNSISHYYRLLSLTPGASQESIHQAFRKKAKELHPDVNPASDAAYNFQMVAEAYQFLLDNYTDLQVLFNRQNSARTTSHVHSAHVTNKSFVSNRSGYKKSFLDDRLGRSVFIFSHLFFILTGLAMIVLPLLTILSFPDKIKMPNGASTLSMLAAMSIGFIMIWRLSQALIHESHRKNRHK